MPNASFDVAYGVNGTASDFGLDVEAGRAVLADDVQRPQMQADQAGDHEGQQIVQAVEAVERRCPTTE